MARSSTSNIWEKYLTGREIKQQLGEAVKVISREVTSRGDIWSGK